MNGFFFSPYNKSVGFNVVWTMMFFRIFCMFYWRKSYKFGMTLVFVLLNDAILFSHTSVVFLYLCGCFFQLVFLAGSLVLGLEWVHLWFCWSVSPLCFTRKKQGQNMPQVVLKLFDHGGVHHYTWMFHLQ